MVFNENIMYLNWSIYDLNLLMFVINYFGFELKYLSYFRYNNYIFLFFK